MEILIYGTINSVALALYALGFALVYGICRLPNFAHGALYVLSGFIAWTMINTLKTNLLVAVLATLIVTGIIGAIIYRLFLIRVRGMEISEIIASYAIALAILEGLRWGGFRGMTYTLPVFIEGSITIGGISVDYQRILVVVVGAALVAFLWAVHPLHPRGPGPPGDGPGRAGSSHAGHRLGYDGGGGHGDGLHAGGLCRHAAFTPGQYRGPNPVTTCLILAIAVCIVGGLGSWMGAVLAAFLNRLCPDPDRILSGVPLPDGGGFSGHYPDVDFQTVGVCSASQKGTGGKGVKIVSNEQRRQREN